MKRTPLAIELRLCLLGEMDIPFATTRTVPHPDRTLDGLFPWPKEHVKMMLRYFVQQKNVFEIGKALGRDEYAVHRKAMTLKLLGPFDRVGTQPNPVLAAQAHEDIFNEKCK